MWPNGWPDWHQLWCTHADSSRKGSWPNKISGGIGVRGWGVGVRNSKVRKSTCEHTHAYSSIKGSRPIGGGGGWGWGVSGGGGG